MNKPAILKSVKMSAIVTVFFISPTRKNDQAAVGTKFDWFEIVVNAWFPPTTNSEIPPIYLACFGVDDRPVNTFSSAAPSGQDVVSRKVGFLVFGC